MQDIRLAALLLGGFALATPFAAPWLPWLGPTPFKPWLLELVWMFALFVTIGIGAKGQWFGLLVDGRNRISLSRLQLTLRTILFSATLLVVYLWNIGQADDISHAFTLTVLSAAWLLMGMAGVSAAGSPAILSAKSPPDPTAAPPPAPADPAKFLDGVVVKRRPEETPQWSDIVLGEEAGNADAIDISKVQQLVLSVVAIAVYGYAIAKILIGATGLIAQLPDMDNGFLALVGAGHATYLVYKGVSHSS